MLHRRNPEELRAYLREAILACGGRLSRMVPYLDVTEAYLCHWLRRLNMVHELRDVRREMATRFRLTG